MRSDSPPMSWYEPPSYTSWEDAELDDDQPTAWPELFILRDGVFWWTAADAVDDDVND